jgi:hypothetical protein
LQDPLGVKYRLAPPSHICAIAAKRTAQLESILVLTP